MAGYGGSAPNTVTAPKTLTTTTAAAPAVDIEAHAKGDTNFSKDKVAARREEYKITTGAAATFLEGTDFVSLGSYCGPSVALQSLGLRRSAYPFDWVRSPVEGIIKCFDHNFQDFLTFSNYREEAGNKGFLSARWGGSFWHHNPQEEKSLNEFTRRIRRLLGHEIVPVDRPRFFVRSANSTAELEDTFRLYETLERTFPDAKIYLLILIDMQATKGPVTIIGQETRNLLFWKVSKTLWDEPRDIHKSAPYYGEGIAFAVRLWSGDKQAKAECKSMHLNELEASCVQWDGGNAATELMNPRVYCGHSISFAPKPRRRVDSRLSPRSEAKAAERKAEPPAPPATAGLEPVPTGENEKTAAGFDAEAANMWSSLAAQPPPRPMPRIPGSDVQFRAAATVPETLFECKLPDKARSGDFINTRAFDRDLRLQVPHGVAGGRTLLLRLRQDGQVEIIPNADPVKTLT